ncbi:MAG: TRAP transporter substrate-binding protein DctP [Burkholderiaceae bacterium]
MKLLRVTVLLATLAASTSSLAAEPITLNFAHFVPPQTGYGKTFASLAADIERQSGGSLKVDLKPGGSFEKVPAKYLGHLQSGAVDIAMLVPSYTPDVFTGYALFHLPFQFATIREAARVHQRMAEQGALPGYDRLKVLAAFTTDSYEIHLREPFDGLESLRGRRIRAADGLHQAMLGALGVQAIPSSNVTTIASSLAAGEVDGSLLGFSPARAFKVIPQAKEHVEAGFGYAPLLLAMDRARYDRLPEAARRAIDAASGPALLDRLIADTEEGASLGRKVAADLGHRVVELSADARDQLRASLGPAVQDWITQDAQRKRLIDDAGAIASELRAK